MINQGSSKLCSVSTKVNSEIYQEILEHFLMPLSEDLAASDTSKLTIKRLHEK